MTLKDPITAARGVPRPHIPRGYKTVTVAEQAGRFQVLLDAKPVMTPLRTALSTPYRALAQAIAAEWDAQNPNIDPATMPLTRLLSTTLDQVAPRRAALIASLMDYADTDLLCYRAAFPESLKARQDAVWQPVLDWLAGSLGIALATRAGIMPGPQSGETVEALRRAVTVLDDDRLCALQACAAITSSLALSLALVHGRLTDAEVFAAAELDETYQMERWGQDDLAAERRRGIETDLRATAGYLGLLKTS